MLNSTLNPTPVPDSDAADRFVQALSRGDFEALSRCMSPDVWFRVLLPRKVVESHGVDPVLERFRFWYERPPERRFASSHHDVVGTRRHLRYRFRLRPEWDPDNWYTVEQAGYCRIKDDVITRLDLVCTGFHPLTLEQVQQLEGGDLASRGSVDTPEPTKDPAGPHHGSSRRPHAQM